jgi:phage-related protein
MSLNGMTNVKEQIVGSIHKVNQIPGYSAYEVAVRNGFNGTEAEWLASLKGEKGDAGTLESHTEIDAQNNRVINVATPTANGDAANKKYVDDGLNATYPAVKAVTSGDDFNNYKTNGIFYFTTDVTVSNAPPEAKNGWIHVMVSAGGAVKQVLYRAGSANTYHHTYVRSFAGGSWTNWSKFAVIESTTLEATTNENGNVNTGLDPASCVVLAATAKDSDGTETYICNFYKSTSVGKWMINVVNVSSKSNVASKAFTFTIYFMSLLSLDS